MLARIAFATIFAIALSASAGAESVEVAFVPRNQSAIQRLSDDDMVRMMEQTEAECTFETNRAIAAAGSVVVPGSSGAGFSHSGSRLGTALSNFAGALAEQPAVLPGMPKPQQWEYFFSCVAAKGYLVTDMAGYRRQKADFEARNPGRKARAVIKTFDF